MAYTKESLALLLARYGTFKAIAEAEAVPVSTITSAASRLGVTNPEPRMKNLNRKGRPPKQSDEVFLETIERHDGHLSAAGRELGLTRQAVGKRLANLKRQGKA